MEEKVENLKTQEIRKNKKLGKRGNCRKQGIKKSRKSEKVGNKKGGNKI